MRCWQTLTPRGDRIRHEDDPHRDEIHRELRETVVDRSGRRVRVPPPSPGSLVNLVSTHVSP